MRSIAVLPFLVGCKLITGIDDTSLIPDARPPDAFEHDAMIDAAVAGPIEVGDGRDGALVVAATMYTDDVRTHLVSNVGVGATLLEVASAADFQVGDEVLIIQMTGDLRGQQEIHHVMSTAIGELQLDGMVKARFAGATERVQVIRIPNYTSVSVPVDAVLTAHAWDGRTGGVVVFRAQGAVVVEGRIDADAIGWRGAAAPGPGPGGLGGDGGHAQVIRACPTLCSNLYTGYGGGPGMKEMGELGTGGPTANMCRGGVGGPGGLHGDDAPAPPTGNLADGPGGALVPGAGGTNAAVNIDRPSLGGGGASGASGRGGRGAGGGGGGGGALTSNGTTSQAGEPGEAGGAGGAGGPGGVGGGIVMVYASKIVVGGNVVARGQAGGNGQSGAIGGKGGDGKFGGTAFGNCGGAQLHGGRGGAGGGGNGGDGGDGGGGGAGGVILLNGIEVEIDGTLLAHGGGTSQPGGAGGAGPRGVSYNTTAMPGQPGVPGVNDGAEGGDGFSYIRFDEACTNCTGIGDPTVTSIDITP